MSKIIKKSQYGFWFQGEDSWAKVDKKFIATPEFKALKVGDNIECNFKRNKDGTPWIIGAKVIPDYISEVNAIGKNLSTKRVAVPLSDNLPNISNHTPDASERRELKLKCLEIVGRNFNGREFTDNTCETIARDAHKLFDQLEAADYYNW